MKEKGFWGFVVLLFIATGCYAGEVMVVETREPAATHAVMPPTREPEESVTAVPVVTITPTRTPLPTFMATAVPISTPTPKPLLTATATWLPAQTPMATADPEKIPQIVWLQYGDASYTDPPSVLAVRAGVAAYEEFPMAITNFWDYSPVSGRVAFSNATRHASPHGNTLSVSDLWVYNYETEQAEMWFSDNVNGASWSSNIHPQTGTELLAVALNSPDSQYGLQILSSSQNVIATIPNASAHFSWSADGQWIAFFGWRDQKHGIYIVPATGGAATYVTHLHWVGSILDRPLWAQEHQAIFDSSSPRLLFIDGTDAVGVPESRSPYNMLWDPKTRQLLMGFEADWGSREEIRVFEFSEDLRTITKDYAIGGIMADWLVPGEKLLLADGQIIDWPITDQ